MSTMATFNQLMAAWYATPPANRTQGQVDAIMAAATAAYPNDPERATQATKHVKVDND